MHHLISVQLSTITPKALNKPFHSTRKIAYITLLFLLAAEIAAFSALSLSQVTLSTRTHKGQSVSYLTTSQTSSSTTESPQPKFHGSTPLCTSTYTQILSTTTLSPIATKLRQSYDNHFRDPREPNSNRFAWDPWFVSVGDGKNGVSSLCQEEKDNQLEEDDENAKRSPFVDGEIEAMSNQIQYSLKRIQSSTFFSEDDYNELVEGITELGRSIGLTAITPPWTSIYTEGDMQNYHTDTFNGPMAFVLSLCKEGDFGGGETIMLNTSILDFWRGFDTSTGFECADIVRYIPTTPLGRCIAFDPRVPHGVNRVTGSHDPRRARVVIHGWFSEPENCLFGSWGDEIEMEEVNHLLENGLQPLVETLGSGEIGRVVGYLAVRLEVDSEGYVDDVVSVCDTLQADMNDFRGIIGYDEADRVVMEDAVSDVRLTISEALKALTFSTTTAEDRAVVIPFLFE